MLKRKITALVTAAIITNFSVASISVSATELGENSTVQTEIQKNDVTQVTKTNVSRFNIYDSKYKDAYNEKFKMDNSNILKVTNNGGNYGNSTLNLATDGDLNTHWETGKPNSDTFKNEVVFELKESIVLNRIVYKSRTGNKGFAEAFKIYGSKSANEDNFELVSEGESSISGELLEFKFNPTEFKKIKFVFEKANQNWAAASEFMFYKEDGLPEIIENIFEDGTMRSLKPEYRSIEKITELEHKVSEHPLKDTLQGNIDLAKTILSGQVDYSKNIFNLKQLGNVHNHAKQDLLMSSFGTNLQSTGIVAVPGETINVYVEAEDGKPLPKIAFTQEEGHYGNWKREYSLKKGLNTFTVPTIYSDGWANKTNKGGAIYLINTYTPNEQGKAPIVRIEGGEKFPIFNEGDNVEEFIKELKAYKQKLDENPNTTVDIFEYNSKRIMFTGKASAAYQVYINEGVNVNDSINVWSNWVDEMFKFAGLEDNPENKKHDSTNVRTPIRVMQPFGGAYASGEHVGIQRHVATHILRTDVNSQKGIIWGTLHELGHQMDIVPRTWGEITNNMWSNMGAVKIGKGDSVDYTSIYENVAPDEKTDKGFEQFNYFGKLGMFWQLNLKQDNYWASLEKMYRERKPTPKNYQEKKDILAKYSSEILGVNLTTYFEKYGFTLSDEIKEELKSMPNTDEKIWYLNTKAIGYTGNGFVSEAKPQIEYLNVGENGTELKFNIDENNKNHLLGYEILRDGKVIGFTKSDSFTDSNRDKSTNYNYEVKAVDIKLNMSKATSRKAFSPTLDNTENVTIKLREEFNPLDYAKGLSYNGDSITDKIKVVSNNVDINTRGEYEVVYELTDNGATETKTTKVMVVSDYIYASDINWESARTDYGQVRKDLASGGAKIKLNINGEEKLFEKGIGTHANSEIIYNLDGLNYEYFESYIGIDRNIIKQNNSSVIFQVFADGEEVYNSGLMKWDDEAKLIKVPVRGVKELKLVLNNSGNGNSSDHGDFGNARFLITNSKPTITTPKDIVTKVGEVVSLEGGYTASDAEDGDITSLVKINGKVNFNKSGNYQITYSVTDNDGNTTVAKRSVKVVDMNNSIYLSNIDWKSANNSYGRAAKDISISGNALRLTSEGGSIVTYEKGIGTHSTSTIIYDLQDKDYGYFTSYVGVDRQMFGTVGSVTFEVWIDNNKVYDSGLMGSRDPQKFVEVNLAGAKEMKLIVTDGGNGNGSDHATWGDTKLHIAKDIEVNYSALEEEIKKANEIEKDNYTQESIVALDGELTKANEIIKDKISLQEEVDAMVLKLQEAIDSLKIKVNLAEVVNIPDKFLKEAIKKTLNLTNENITIGDMYKLNSLTYNQRIESLEGLQYAKNLESLNIENNIIRDLSPLKDLKKLTQLNVSYQMIASGMLNEENKTININDVVLNKNGERLTPKTIGIRNNSTFKETIFDIKDALKEDGSISFNTQNLEVGVYSLYIVYENKADNYLANVLYMFRVQ